MPQCVATSVTALTNPNLIWSFGVDQAMLTTRFTVQPTATKTLSPGWDVANNVLWAERVDVYMTITSNGASTCFTGCSWGPESTGFPSVEYEIFAQLDFPSTSLAIPGVMAILFTLFLVVSLPIALMPLIRPRRARNNNQASEETQRARRQSNRLDSN
jgi:hypothetical protein